MPTIHSLRWAGWCLIVTQRISSRRPSRLVANTARHTQSMATVTFPQAAFCPANFIPGIEPTPDRVLQGRMFAYKGRVPRFSHSLRAAMSTTGTQTPSATALAQILRRYTATFKLSTVSNVLSTIDAVAHQQPKAVPNVQP